MYKFLKKYGQWIAYALYFPGLYYMGDVARWIVPDTSSNWHTVVLIGLALMLLCAWVAVALWSWRVVPSWRMFKLRSVRLTHRQHFPVDSYREDFIFDDIEWRVPARNTTFWIDLEDTDQTENEKYGYSQVCRPVMHRSLDNLEQFDESDMVRVHIDANGEAHVRYVGPSYVIPDISWELSKVLEDGK